jgi:hypothetical protein
LLDDKQVRKMVFDQELFKLIQHQLITEEDYKKISYAHKRYYEEVELDKSSPSKYKIKGTKPNIPIAPKPQRILSPQDIRERNISWILIIGVVLVLMSGLVLATSTWAMMNNTFKTLLISLVAGLFFGISIVAGKLLKIEKTSFAFWVLGSLFLPVAVLSAGYFELFGHYLSIFGEGKYLLGALGATLCLPVYLYSSKRYNNRLFVWISLITLSGDVAFLLASMNLKIDLFYFSIVLYNGLILYIHSRLKNNENLKLFTAEVPIFAQANLILSTFFMMAFYDNAVFYGFNILLTAALYILMVFSQGHNEYIYVFSGLVIYGIYQITENSFLSDMDLFIYAMIGFIFVGLERYLKKEEAMQKIFYYTNAVVSAFAFFYISLQGIFIRMDQSSWVLFFAYVAIALNYLYLSNRTSKKLFAYLTPIFFVSAAYQGYILIQKYITLDVESGVMFGVGILMFIFLYFKNSFKYLLPIKESGLLTSLVVMLGALASGFIQEQFILVSLEFIVLGLAFYIMYKTEAKELVKQVCRFAVPSTWFIAAFILCFRTGLKLNKSSHGFDEPYYFLVSVLVTFGLGYLWEKYDSTLKKPFHYVAHIVMPLSMLGILIEHPDEPYAFILITAIYVYSLLASHREWKKKVFLYASFTAGVITVFSLIEALAKVIKFMQRYTFTEYTLSIGAILIGVLWFLMNSEWRERTAYYLIPFNMLALFLLMFIYPFQYAASIIMLVCIGLEVYLMHYYKLQMLQVLPLWIFVVGLNQFIDFKFKPSGTAVLVVLVVSALILKIIGELLSDRLYGKNTEHKALPVYFDWFMLTALALTAQIGDTTSTFAKYSKGYDMIAPIIIVYILYSQIKRVPKGLPSSIAKTLTGLSLLIPYYTLIGKTNHLFYKSTLYRLIETELYLFPWIVLVMVISKKVWTGYEHITNKVEMCILIIVALVLCKDLPGTNQLSEGLILGTLSLVSIIGGMQFKKKSFFFVGSGVLIFNMFIQTRDFWGNLPWWVYLLVAGMLLIGTASLHEMQKNKKTKKIDKQAILDKFKDWN